MGIGLCDLPKIGCPPGPLGSGITVHRKKVLHQKKNWMPMEHTDSTSICGSCVTVVSERFFVSFSVYYRKNKGRVSNFLKLNR